MMLVKNEDSEISINKKSIRWSAWSEYSECSVTCGDGISTRTRECINDPAGHCGCEIGGLIEQISCNKKNAHFGRPGPSTVIALLLVTMGVR